ncbi:glycosyltransferase family A protein [Aeromonas salmonicida]
MDKQDYQDIEIIVVDNGSLSLVYSWDAMVHFSYKSLGFMEPEYWLTK